LPANTPRRILTLISLFDRVLCSDNYSQVIECIMHTKRSSKSIVLQVITRLHNPEGYIGTYALQIHRLMLLSILY
jgi:hypothetical protein